VVGTVGLGVVWALGLCLGLPRTQGDRRLRPHTRLGSLEGKNAMSLVSCTVIHYVIGQLLSDKAIIRAKTVMNSITQHYWPVAMR